MKMGILSSPLHLLARVCLLLGVVGFLASCGSKRHVGPSTRGLAQTERERYYAALEHLEGERRGWSAIRGSIKGEIDIKGKNLSSRMNLVATRGEGIRLSVVPFPLVEALRVWFTREGVTVVDLINGRYAQESYLVFSEHLGFELGYEQLEALLLGQIFVPSSSRQDTDALRSLAYTALPDGMASLSGRVRKFRYEFGLSSAYELESFAVYGEGKARLFAASYQGRESLSPQTTMPRSTELALYRGQGLSEATPLGHLRLQWSRINAQDEPDLEALQPRIRPSYERISLQDILKLVNAL